MLPLFNALLILLHFEQAKTNLENVIRLYHYTFKKFLMIPKTTNTEIVDEMIGMDFRELASINAHNAQEKWEARKSRTIPQTITWNRKENYLKGIPNDWCVILKQLCGICPQCKDSTKFVVHVDVKHKICIPMSHKGI